MVPFLNSNMQKFYEIPICSSKFMFEELKQGRFVPSAKTYTELYIWRLYYCFVFLKKFFSKVKNSFQFLTNFNYEALWRPFYHKLAPQPEFF